MNEPGSAAPPGWYQDHSGYLRWWDGARWGPYAPPPAPQESGQALSVVSHLGIVAGGFILPLVIYLTEGKKNPFVRHHAREALNFQLSFLILYLGTFVLLVGAFFVPAASSFGDDGAFSGFFFPFPLIFLVWFGALGFSIMGALRANQRQWWSYPLAIRFVKGDDGG
ncbi:MAG TPA: DUF4870 domain-containing protein [Acidimicrobiales bacterium]|nr:DUF4870 domain-containing protein [Acidimicrobiales bacterium]